MIDANIRKTSMMDVLNEATPTLPDAEPASKGATSMGIRLCRVSWRSVNGQLTGTVMSDGFQGGPGNETISVMVDGGPRVIHRVRADSVIELSDKRDFAYGNKPLTSQESVRNLSL